MKIKFISVVLILSLLIFDLFGCTGFYQLKDSERSIFENNFPPNGMPIDVDIIVSTNDGINFRYLPNEARIIKNDSGKIIVGKSSMIRFSEIKYILLQERFQIQTTDRKTYEFGNAGLSFCFTNGMLTHLQGKTIVLSTPTDVIIKIENVKDLTIEKPNVGTILAVAGALIVIGIVVASSGSSPQPAKTSYGAGGM